MYYNKNKLNQHKNIGSILIFILIIISASVFFVLTMYLITYSSFKVQLSALEYSRLCVLAHENMWQAIKKVSEDKEITFDHTNELWAQAITNYYADGTKVLVYTIDENRFFDINNLASTIQNTNVPSPLTILYKTISLTETKIPSEKLDFLCEYITTNHNKFGSFYSSYLNTNILAYHAPLICTLEMKAILSEKNSKDFPLNNLITILPKNSDKITKVNINTAHENLLIAILGNEAQDNIKEICLKRNIKPITSISQEIKSEFLNTAMTYLDTKSEWFSIFVTAEKDTKLATIYALIYRDKTGKITISRWLEK